MIRALQMMLRNYYADLSDRFNTSFDPSADAHPGEYDLPQGVFYLALLFGRPVGCGALRFLNGYAEVKKVWVDPAYRRRGIAAKLLSRLERRGREAGNSRYPARHKRNTDRSDQLLLLSWIHFDRTV